MIEDDDAYRVHLNAGLGQDPGESQSESSEPQPVTDTPFCLGILGDFSGSVGLGEDTRHGSGHPWPLARVTPENVLSFAGFSPTLRVQGPKGTTEPQLLTLKHLDGFHPNQLFEGLPSLEPLRLSRQALFEGKDAPNGGFDGGPDSTREPLKSLEPTTGPSSKPSFLDSVLEETQREIDAGTPGLEDDLDGFIRRVVRPHVVVDDPDRAAKIAALDALASNILSDAIQDPGFLELESLWRSVVFLLSQVQVDTNLRVYLIDIPKSVLVHDLLRTDEPTDWGLGSLFFDPVSEKGEQLRWAGLIGAYSFGKDPEDIPVLQRIGFLSEAAEVPWFSSGDTALLGCQSLADTPEPRDWTDPIDPLWSQVRQNAEAHWISLAFPEFLLATGFRPRRARPGAFSFTKSTGMPAYKLWGNPGFLSGIGLARAYSDSGWRMKFPGQVSIENVLTETPEGGQRTRTRVPLSHSAAAQARESGLTVVLSFQDQEAIRLEGFRSISVHGGPVKAWWRGDR